MKEEKKLNGECGSNSDGTELFKRILDDANMAVYVVDAATSEILYASDRVKDFFPSASVPCDGPCYQTLIGRTKPCTFCRRERLSQEKLTDREHFFKKFGKDYIFSGKYIDWNGKAAIINYVYDNTLSYEEKQLLKNNYRAQITLMSDVSPNALGTYRINLTKNAMKEPLGTTSKGFEEQKPETVDELFEYAYEHCGTLEDEKAYSDKFSREKLMQSFNEGITNMSLDHRYYMEPDRPKWIKTAVSMAKNPANGDIEGILYTVDINREKVLEELLESVAANDYDSILLLDASTEEALDIHGGRRLADFGQTFPETFCYDEALHEYLEKRCADTDVGEIEQKLKIGAVARELMGKRIYHVYYNIYDNVGRRLHKKASFYRIELSGRLICNTIQDVTEAFENEEKKSQQLHEALQISKHASDAKSEFLTRVSRGIRTPLNSILGLTQIARTETHDPIAVEEYLNSIKTSGTYISGLIDDILDLNQIEDNKLELQPEVIDIREFLHTLDSIMRPRIIEKKLRFCCETRNLITPRVLADKLRLEQIFIKLLENAVRFTPEGGEIRITVSELLRKENTTTLKFVVQDTGLGIAPENYERIFIPFAFGEDNDKSRNSGMGIGLALTKSYVTAMAGTISVESKEGHGTAFSVTLTLPIAKERSVEFGRLQEKSLPETDFTGRKILLVEDHPLNQEIAKKLLEKVGFSVDTASDGQEAVSAFSDKTKHYDLILMDIRMPVMDGFTATREIRGMDRPDARDIPIIAMTANAFEDDIRRSFEAGMNEHLAKPINPQKLYETLAKFIMPES